MWGVSLILSFYHTPSKNKCLWKGSQKAPQGAWWMEPGLWGHRFWYLSETCRSGKKMETVTDFIFLAFRITVDSDCSHEIKRCLLFGRKAVINLDSILKSRDITLLTYSQSYGFSSSHVQMWELGHKEGWVPKNWCFQTMLLEKTLERSLDSKEIKSVNPQNQIRNQPWIFIGRTCWLKLQYFGHPLGRAD